MILFESQPAYSATAGGGQPPWPALNLQDTIVSMERQSEVFCKWFETHQVYDLLIKKPDERHTGDT
jgi:hypothetical protein